MLARYARNTRQARHVACRRKPKGNKYIRVSCYSFRAEPLLSDVCWHYGNIQAWVNPYTTPFLYSEHIYILGRRNVLQTSREYNRTMFGTRDVVCNKWLGLKAVSCSSFIQNFKYSSQRLHHFQPLYVFCINCVVCWRRYHCGGWSRFR